MNNKGFSEEIKRKCIPIFSRNKNVTIIKKENGFILSSPKTLSTIRMNNLTYEILMLCNGKNNLLSISNTIRNKYDVSEEKIDQDIANLLYPLWKLKLIMFKNGIIPFKKHFRITGEDRKTEFTVEYSSADLYDFLQGNRDFFYCNIESTDLIEVNKKFLVSSFIANAIVFFSLKYNGDRCITIGVNPHFIEYPFFNCTYINIQYLYINAEMINYISKQNIDKFFRWVTIWVHNEVNLVFPDKTIYYYLLLNEQSELNKTIIKKIGLYHQNILKKEYKGKSAELFEKKVDMI
jgi:hypothetical protein